MILHSCTPTQQLWPDNPVQIHVFSSPCKLQNLPSSPFNSKVFLGYSLSNHPTRPDYSLHSVSPSFKADQLLSSSIISSTQKQNPKGTKVLLGFKLQCHSRRVALPAYNAKRKKSYGGVLPSILRSLDSGEDIEKTLDLYHGNLSPKEQTVILKEQRSLDRLLRVFEWMKLQEDYLPNVIHYNVVLQTLGRARKWDELRLCWIEMAKRGVVPTNNTYALLIDLYGKAGLAKEAVLWVNHMKISGIFPDEVTMNTVVRVLKDAGEYDRAHKFYKDWCIGRIVLDSMDDNGSESEPMSLKHFLLTEVFRSGGPPSEVLALSDAEASVRKPRLTATYNTLIDLFGKAGRLKDAAEVFEEMHKSRVAADTFTFNTMIFTYGSHGHLSEAEALLSKMEKRGILPDTKTYNIFLSLYADVGRIYEALRCYRKIREGGLFPDVVTYRAILHVLCERKMVQEVEVVIQEMEKAGKRIDMQSLPVIVKMYVNEGLTNRAKSLFEMRQLDGGLSSKTYAAIIDVYAEKGLWAEAEAVFFCKRLPIGQKKDVVEYNVMVKAYGKAKLYDKAYSLFKGMRTHGTWPDECTYNSLIQMFCGGDLVDQAKDLLVEMRGAGFKPSCLTYSSVIASYIRSNRLSDAVDVYGEMAKAGVKPNEFVFGSLIDGFAENGDFEAALHYFHTMEELGILANQVVLTCLIKAYSKVGSVEEAKLLYEKIKHFEGGPDIAASNSMLNLCAEIGLISEARSIFDTLRERGSADDVSFTTMMYLYKNMGMLNEAMDVAEEMKNSGLLKDSVLFNKLMAYYATNSQLVACAEMLNDMTCKILLDNGTFKVLFTVMKKGDVLSEAVKQLKSSYRKGKPYAREAIMTVVFSIAGLHSLALEVCESFIKAEMGLEAFAYNVAIYAYGASGRITEALNVYLRMKDKGVEPDIVTFINLVGCYGKADMVDGIKQIYNLIKYRKIEPDDSLLKALVDAYKTAIMSALEELVSQEMKFTLDSQFSSDYLTEELSFESEIEDELDESYKVFRFHGTQVNVTFLTMFDELVGFYMGLFFIDRRLTQSYYLFFRCRI